MLGARTNEFSLGLRGMRTFDLTKQLALDAGIGLSVIYFDQHFQTQRLAPPRRSWGSYAELVLGLSYDLTTRAYIALETALQSYVLPMLDAKSGRDALQAAFAWRLALGVGTRF